MIRNEVTPSQFQIVLLISKGWSNKRIADHFHRSEMGIKNSVQKILTRTGMASRLELSVQLAWEEGWYGQGSKVDGVVFGGFNLNRPYRQFQFQ